MNLADFRDEIERIEERIAAEKMTLDDLALLRQAVYAWRDQGQPATGPIHDAYQLAARAVDLSVTRSLERFLAAEQRRELVKRLQREVDELNREEARVAAADAARRRREKHLVGTVLDTTAALLTGAR